VPRRGACAQLLYFGSRSPTDERITGKSAQLGGAPAKNFDPNILRELAAAPTFPVYGSSSADHTCIG